MSVANLDQAASSRAPAAIERISVRIPMAIAMTGISRSRIYELIATGELQIAKDRRCTLILVESLRDVVARRVIRAGDGPAS